MAPSSPPDWLWQFRDADWAHVESPPMPADFGFGEAFWRHCRARDYWREQCRGWLRDNDRFMSMMWPPTRAEFKAAAEAEPWKVLRHDRDRPRRAEL